MRRARAGRWADFRLGLHGGLTRGAWSEGERAAGRFRLRAASRLGARSEFSAYGPWADFIFGPNFVVNSNFSQFIYCSEIV
jgi:hypothetical protein